MSQLFIGEDPVGSKGRLVRDDGAAASALTNYELLGQRATQPPDEHIFGYLSHSLTPSICKFEYGSLPTTSWSSYSHPIVILYTSYTHPIPNLILDLSWRAPCLSF